jgi:hypothetical protein
MLVVLGKGLEWTEEEVPAMLELQTCPGQMMELPEMLMPQTGPHSVPVLHWQDTYIQSH